LKHGRQSKVRLFHAHVAHKASQRDELGHDAIVHHALGSDRIALLKGTNAGKQKLGRCDAIGGNEGLRGDLE